MGPCIPDRSGIWKCRFLWRGEKPSEQEREPTTNSTHIWLPVRESNPGHIGGKRVLSPLRHYCSPPRNLACKTITEWADDDAALSCGNEPQYIWETDARETDTSTNQRQANVHHVPLDEVSAILSHNLPSALSSFHAITGCDSTSFMICGNQRWHFGRFLPSFYFISPWWLKTSLMLTPSNWQKESL